MSLILNECIEFNDKRKICVATEKGKTYTLNNISNYKVRKVKIDKCLPQKESEKRCDYLIDIDDQDLKRVIFIELKGSKLADALRQIYSTIIYLSGEYKNYTKDARIVGSRNVPGFIDLHNYKKLAKEIFQNGTIGIRTNKVYFENI